MHLSIESDSRTVAGQSQSLLTVQTELKHPGTVFSDLNSVCSDSDLRGTSE